MFEDFKKEPDFSGMLICTDFDGTLYDHGIPPCNALAINYFMDHGGLFTLCSGRDGRLLSGGNLPFTPNAPAACMNGALIYDFQKDSILARFPMGDKYYTILDELVDAMPLSRADIVSENLRIGFDLYDKEEYEAAKARIDSPVYKLVVYKDAPSDDYVPETAARVCEGKVNVLSNSRNCFELTAHGINKASGSMLVKKLTGADMLIAVGDCNGDISMFGVSDDSFAVGNSIPDLRRIAGHVTKATVTEGAFPEIIRTLALTSGGAG